MSGLSVYRYQSAIEFLRDAIAERKRSDPKFSIRRFCKETDFGSHAYLVMILRKRRQLTLRVVPALAKGLGLDHEERIFFKTLVQLDNATTEEEKNLVRLWLNDLNPRRDYRILEADHYHLIADWIHMAILSLAKIEGAEITAESVHSAIRRKIPLSQVREAIERLFDLGLLQKNGDQVVPTYDSIRTKDDVASRGGREYHRQVSKLAAESLEEQDPSIREFQAFAFTLPAGKIALAKEMIRKFRHQLVQVMEAEPGAEVYQCNLQLFRLTEHPSTIVSKADEGRSNAGETSFESPSVEMTGVPL